MPFGQAGQVRREWSFLRPGFSCSLPVGRGGTWTGRPPHEQCRVGETWETSQGHRGGWMVGALPALKMETTCCPLQTASGFSSNPSFPSISCLTENSRCPIALMCEPRGTSATLTLTCSPLTLTEAWFLSFVLGEVLTQQGLCCRKTKDGTADKTRVQLYHLLITCPWSNS